ncbi:MAG: single-stranded DNA-binding protein [Candidatus Omnitrophica bacterium]|nr:single-stranded DNA-binding protein [Candidatus Omnitrophota bacterium]
MRRLRINEIKEMAMANFNKVLLIGNLTRDPELRYTPQGTAVVNLRLAVNSRFRTKSQELKEDTCFVTVVVWDKQAESCNQYLHKGSSIFVEGRLQSRSFEDNTGQKRNVIEVRADRVQFLGLPSAKLETEPIEESLPESSTQDTWLEEGEDETHEG